MRPGYQGALAGAPDRPGRGKGGRHFHFRPSGTCAVCIVQDSPIFHLHPVRFMVMLDLVFISGGHAFCGTEVMGLTKIHSARLLTEAGVLGGHEIDVDLCHGI